MSSCDSTPVADEYDYIIVGGGTAGCVLAARLSEDADVSVLVLEAGADQLDQAFDVRAPARYGDLQLTGVDWKFKTEPQVGQGGRIGNWPRGRCLGGCSAINAMVCESCRSAINAVGEARRQAGKRFV